MKPVKTRESSDRGGGQMQRGYTVLEVLIVTISVGILAALAVWFRV